MISAGGNMTLSATRYRVAISQSPDSQLVGIPQAIEHDMC